MCEYKTSYIANVLYVLKRIRNYSIFRCFTQQAYHRKCILAISYIANTLLICDLYR